MYTVYVIKQNEEILYVGKTIDLQRRKYEHRYRKKLDRTYQFIPLQIGLTKEEAKELEEKYIQKYGTFKNGWNLTAGEGTRLVESKKGDGRCTKGNRLSDKRVRKRVICLDTGEIFNSIKECADKLGINQYGIYKACDGQLKTYKKFHFQYI